MPQVPDNSQIFDQSDSVSIASLHPIFPEGLNVAPEKRGAIW